MSHKLYSTLGGYVYSKLYTKCFSSCVFVLKLIKSTEINRMIFCFHQANKHHRNNRRIHYISLYFDRYISHKTIPPINWDLRFMSRFCFQCHGRLGEHSWISILASSWRKLGAVLVHKKLKWNWDVSFLQRWVLRWRCSGGGGETPSSSTGTC